MESKRFFFFVAHSVIEFPGGICIIALQETTPSMGRFFLRRGFSKLNFGWRDV